MTNLYATRILISTSRPSWQWCGRREESPDVGGHAWGHDEPRACKLHGDCATGAMVVPAVGPPCPLPRHRSQPHPGQRQLCRGTSLHTQGLPLSDIAAALQLPGSGGCYGYHLPRSGQTGERVRPVRVHASVQQCPSRSRWTGLLGLAQRVPLQVSPLECQFFTL